MKQTLITLALSLIVVSGYGQIFVNDSNDIRLVRYKDSLNSYVNYNKIKEWSIPKLRKSKTTKTFNALGDSIKNVANKILDLELSVCIGSEDKQYVIIIKDFGVHHNYFAFNAKFIYPKTKVVYQPAKPKPIEREYIKSLMITYSHKGKADSFKQFLSFHGVTELHKWKIR